MPEILYNPHNPAGGAASAYAYDEFWYYDESGAWFLLAPYKSIWHAGEIRQGGRADGAAGYFNHYGVVRFDFAAIRAQNETHRPTSIRLVFTAAVNQSAETLRVYLGKNLAGWAQSSRPVAATGTSYKTVVGSGTADGESELVVTDPAWLAALVDPATMCVYINRHPSGTGNGATSPWDTGLFWRGNGPATKMYVNWEPRQPSPSAPVPDNIDDITSTSKTFSWAESADSFGYFSPEELSYQMKLEVDGVLRPDIYETEPGVTEYTISDIKAVGVLTDSGLLAGQYFRMPCKIHVRAITPPWGDPAQPIYSEWAESNEFLINFAIPPAAPRSLALSNASPYEGEGITFSVGRPPDGQYNTHDSNGEVMQLHYYVMLEDGTVLADGVAPVTAEGKELSYQVGELATNMSDWATAVKARCVDTEGQHGQDTEPVSFTIKRFRAPIVVIPTNIERTETTAIVPIRIVDTGYAASQSGDQIRMIQYKLYPFEEAEPAEYTDGELGEWTGLDNTLTINSLDAGTRYNLKIRAVNKAPEGTGLADKPGACYEDTIWTYLPTSYYFKRHDEPVEGEYTQVLIVGDDTEVDVEKGCAKVQYDIDAGRAIRMAGKPVVTGVPDAPGLEGNLAAWNEDGDLVDALLPAEKAVAGDTHQLIQHGWGYIRGDGSQEISTTVTFAEEFDDIPDIAVSCSGYTRDYAYGPPSHKGDASIAMNEGDKPFGGYFLPTKSNFRVHITRPGANLATNRYYIYTWIAIGPKARTRPSQ